MKNSLLVLFICFPLLVVAQESYRPLKNTKALKDGIAQMAAATETIKTSFIQEKYVSILTNAIISEGQMLFKKPQTLKWAYTKPYNYAILFTKDKILINDEGKVNSFDISSSQAFVQINEIIINSVSGNILQEEQFDIEYFVGDKDFLAKLYPKVEQLKAYIEVIEVYVSKQDYTVTQIKLDEKGDDYTLINLTDKKLNVDIPDEALSVN